MAELCDAVASVHAHFRAAVAERHVNTRGWSAELFTRQHLAEVTGIPELRVEPYRDAVGLRGDTLLVVSPSWISQGTDFFVSGCDIPLSFNQVTADMTVALRTKIRNAARWLQASPHRRVFFRTYQGRNHSLVVVLVWIYVDMREPQRRTTASTSPPPQLLHDVMSTLHGWDRRRAAAVCVAWRTAASDVLLPVAEDDIRIWLAPRIAELHRCCPSVEYTEIDVALLWALTRYWLAGGE
jgi:hypothetical protein